MKALGTIFAPVDLIIMHYVGVVGVGSTSFRCLRKLEICNRNTGQYKYKRSTHLWSQLLLLISQV